MGTRVNSASPSSGFVLAIDPRAPFVWAEVDYALEHEYVERMEDLLDRRLGAFLLAPECDLGPKIANWLAARNRPTLVPQICAESRR